MAQLDKWYLLTLSLYIYLILSLHNNILKYGFHLNCVKAINRGNILAVIQNTAMQYAFSVRTETRC